MNLDHVSNASIGIAFAGAVVGLFLYHFWERRR